MRELAESSLVRGAGSLWGEATEAEFLTAIGDGTLPEDCFRRWLEQDYLFAVGLTSFQAITAEKTPRPSHKIIIDGLVAMDQELDWFEMNSEYLNCDLETPAHPAGHHYTDFLIASAYEKPFQILLAILYGVEVSYLFAWSSLKAEGPYEEFIARWSNENFRAYVKGLHQLTIRHPHPGAEEAFNEVLRHEREFWRMTWEG